MGPGDPAPRRIPKRQEDTRPPKTCRRMFAVLLFIIAPNWKQLKCPFDGAWIDHLRPTQTLGYYSARREALSCTRPGRFGWCIMRSERSQTQKAACRMIPFQWRSGKKKKKTQNWSDPKRIGGFQGPAFGRRAALMTEEHEGTCRGDGAVLCPDRGWSYRVVCVGQNVYGSRGRIPVCVLNLTFKK